MNERRGLLGSECEKKGPMFAPLDDELVSQWLNRLDGMLMLNHV